MSMLYGFWHGMIVHLWQTTLTLGLLLLFERALRGAPSRASHALWSVALAKLLLPLSLFGGLGDLLYRFAGHPVDGAGAGSPMLKPVLAVLNPFGGSRSPASGSTLSYLLVAATSCWAALALFLLARMVLDLVRSERGDGRTPGALDAATARRLERILEEARVPREVFLVSAGFEMPAVSGIVRPRIVVPQHLVFALSDEELCAIIVHEDSHRRRRDPLLRVAHRIAMALFFFYPPLYAVLRRLRTTAELSCDECVVHRGISGASYARALAHTLALGLASPPFASAAAVAGGSLLKRRLERLSTLDPRRYAMRSRYSFLIVLAALLVAAATLYSPPMRAGLLSISADMETSARDTEQGRSFFAFDEAPVLVKYTQPAYPELAKKSGAEGTVLLDVLVGANGKVHDVTLIKIQDFNVGGPGKHGKPEISKIRGAFRRSAIASVRHWDFKPALKDDRPVPAHVAIPVRFKLN